MRPRLEWRYRLHQTSFILHSTITKIVIQLLRALCASLKTHRRAVLKDVQMPLFQLILIAFAPMPIAFDVQFMLPLLLYLRTLHLASSSDIYSRFLYLNLTKSASMFPILQFKRSSNFVTRYCWTKIRSSRDQSGLPPVLSSLGRGHPELQE